MIKTKGESLGTAMEKVSGTQNKSDYSTKELLNDIKPAIKFLKGIDPSTTKELLNDIKPAIQFLKGIVPATLTHGTNPNPALAAAHQYHR
jgi:hypothetical protein